jgi:lipid II:glycine glycyltransferase (peptidoglycan interpeptide bridge formation enzyme)
LWDRFGAGVPSEAAPESGASLWEAPPAVRVLLAEHEGRAIAGIVLIVSGATVRYAYGASHEEYLHLGPNNLLMWEAIAWACQSGYARFDLGRTAYDNVGLMDFKRGWGAKQEPLTYYYWPRRTGLATTQEHSWKYRAATSIWRRLPLPVAETLGSAVYRHLG